MGELAIDLKTELDRIDAECIEYASDRYYASRLRMLIGIWEKGEAISPYRGVKGETSFRQLEKETGRKQENLKRWHEIFIKYPDKETYIEEEAKLRALEWTNKALKEKNVHVSNNSGENEWYTPPEIIESARKVMGSIDLDPATSLLANEIVKAERIFTKEDNGLNQQWEGNIWLNPPYSQPLISQFSDKVINESQNIEQACVLTNNATETEWYQQMMQICNCICFVKGRLKFIDINGNASGTPLQGQTIIYIGKYVKEFYNEFKKYGICMKKIT